jgi:hypothetical protein
MLLLHLLQNFPVYTNTLMLQNVLNPGPWMHPSGWTINRRDLTARAGRASYAVLTVRALD